MEWYMWIVTFMVGSFFANLLLRWMYGKKHYFYKQFEEIGYEKGYRDGAINVKMFYSMKASLPSTSWLTAQKGKQLDTREKFLATTKEGN